MRERKWVICRETERSRGTWRVWEPRNMIFVPPAHPGPSTSLGMTGLGYRISVLRFPFSCSADHVSELLQELDSLRFSVGCPQ